MGSLERLVTLALGLLVIFGIPFIAVMLYRLARRRAGKGKGLEDAHIFQKAELNTKWKWRGVRWLIAYVGFWFVAGSGAGIIARSSSPEIQGGASSFVTLIVVIILIWCAVKDRGTKTASHKVGWVVGLWIAYSLASVFVTFALAELGVWKVAHLERMGNMIAGFMILYFAIRRSTVFVEQAASLKAYKWPKSKAIKQ